MHMQNIIRQLNEGTISPNDVYAQGYAIICKDGRAVGLIREGYYAK